MTTRIPIAVARKQFADLLNRANRHGERIKLTRYDRTLAIIIPKHDFKTLENCEGDSGREPSPARRRAGGKR